MGNSESHSASKTKPPTPPEVMTPEIIYNGRWEVDVKFLEAASKKGRKLGKIPVVLVGSGAFCPVHRGHLLMMRAAAKALPDKRHVVVGAIVVPAHDDYIDTKMSHSQAAQHFKLPFGMRSKLIRATASDLQFSDTNGSFPVHISDAEHTQRACGLGVVGNIRTLYNLCQQNGNFEGEEKSPCPALVWVNGDDKWFTLFSIRTPRTSERGCDGVVVVSRDCELHPRLAKAKADGVCQGLKQIGYSVGESQGVSSSKLRAAVEVVLASHTGDSEACVKGITTAVAPFMSPSAAAIYAQSVVDQLVSTWIKEKKTTPISTESESMSAIVEDKSLDHNINIGDQDRIVGDEDEF